MANKPSLTPEQAQDARRLYETGGFTLEQLGTRYDVHWETVRRAIIKAGGTIAPQFGTRKGKLSDAQVEEIRQRVAASKRVTFAALALEYGVSAGMISAIVAGRKRVNKSG